MGTLLQTLILFSLISGLNCNAVHASIAPAFHAQQKSAVKPETKQKIRLLEKTALQQRPAAFENLLREISRIRPLPRLVDARGTPLIIALVSLAVPGKPHTQNYETMIESLIRIFPASVAEKDKAYVGDGRTALHQAAANGNLKVMALLIRHHADVNARNASGETPLHLAARFGHVEPVRYLVSARARVNERTTFTKATPLMSAAEMGQETVIRLLMMSGANKEIKDAFGKTPPQRYKEYTANFLDRIATPSKKR